MYVRLVRFDLPLDKESVAADLARDLVPEIRQQPGCRAVTCFGDPPKAVSTAYMFFGAHTRRPTQRPESFDRSLITISVAMLRRLPILGCFR